MKTTVITSCLTIVTLFAGVDAQAAQVELVGKEQIVLDFGKIALGNKSATSSTRQALRNWFKFVDTFTIPEHAEIVSDVDRGQTHIRTIRYAIDGSRLFGDIMDCRSNLRVQVATTCTQEECTTAYKAKFVMARRGDSRSNCFAK